MSVAGGRCSRAKRGEAYQDYLRQQVIGVENSSVDSMLMTKFCLISPGQMANRVARELAGRAAVVVAVWVASEADGADAARARSFGLGKITGGPDGIEGTR